MTVAELIEKLQKLDPNSLLVTSTVETRDAGNEPTYVEGLTIYEIYDRVQQDRIPSNPPFVCIWGGDEYVPIIGGEYGEDESEVGMSEEDWRRELALRPDHLAWNEEYGAMPQSLLEETCAAGYEWDGEFWARIDSA